MRVLVTGASGFVGSHVTQALVEAGLEVGVGLRATSDPRWLRGLPVAQHVLDLDAPQPLARALDGVEVVVHAAGITRAAHANDYARVNAEGTRRLLHAAVAAGVRRCVLISSLAARGPDRPPSDLSPYARSKLEAERIAAALRGQLEIAALRVAGVYGPRDTDLLPLFRLARRGVLLLPPRHGRLQPVYAGDVADLVARIVVQPIGFGPWPVAEARSYGWDELARLLGAALGTRVRAAHAPRAVFVAAALASEGLGSLRRRPSVLDRRRALDLTASYTCDTTATEAASGWRARVELADGLERTVAWYRASGWL